MPYISEPGLRDRLPNNGDGVSVAQTTLALNSAIEYVAGITGDTQGDSFQLQEAVVNRALAQLLDTVIYPGDARRPGSESSTLRQSATQLIADYMSTKTDKDKDFQPDVPNGYSGVMSF